MQPNAVLDDKELISLRRVVRAFMAGNSPVQRALELMESSDGFDRDVWRKMSTQLELPALMIPEAFGGQGFGFNELAVVLEEMGRVVYMGPFFATVLATTVLIGSGDESACAALLPDLADGTRTATFAVNEPDAGWELDVPQTTATFDGDAWRVSGTKDLVLDGATADFALVTAQTKDGVGLFVVEADSPGMLSEPLAVLDLTRPMARLDLDAVVATRVDVSGTCPDLLRDAMRHARAALACEQAGAARRCVEMTVAYVTERVQFGRPVGSFQAVRHRCADMLVLSELSGAIERHAARAVSESDPEVDVVVAVAKSFCSEALLDIVDATIQLHGGTGFTWAHPAHLYLKRAKASELLFGDPAEQRASVAAALLAPAPSDDRLDS